MWSVGPWISSQKVLILAEFSGVFKCSLHFCPRHGYHTFSHPQVSPFISSLFILYVLFALSNCCFLGNIKKCLYWQPFTVFFQIILIFSISLQFYLNIKSYNIFVNVPHAAQNCSGLRTCGQCLEQPGCGWCNDPSNTGRGHCIEGSSRGPMKLVGMHSNEMLLDTSLCPKEKNYEWSFIQCPGNKNVMKIISVSAWGN